MLVFLMACGTPTTAECGPEECAAVCDQNTAPAPAPAAPTEGKAGKQGKAGGQKMTTFEHQLLDEVLEDVRAGVRPWDDQAVGVCAGKKECTSYLGMDAGVLAKGDYMVKAELRVPQIGEKGTWKVDFHSECSIDHGAAAPEVRTYDRTYDVWYGGPERGYRLMPLRTFESPSKGGAQTCKYTITAKHPDGDKVYAGSWSTPAE
ncbi:MAG: hypothetical protein H6735_29880 [Alphaproteobacteria bacterium]|nr:hypothetical protein [Alphaproteobacteria bacterium]